MPLNPTLVVPHIARTVMTQRWRQLTFLHWGYAPDVLQRLLPPGLTIDTFNDKAWVGLVPFVISEIRRPPFPVLPWISGFPETNVRTYVLGPDNQPGVWFFTLEADRLFAVLGARHLYHLPYRWANMQVCAGPEQVTYRSHRLPPFGRGMSDIHIWPSEKITVSPFDDFLTARFRLYAAHGRRLAYAEIAHPPWPLRHATAPRLDQDLIEQCGIPSPKGEPIVHYADDLQVRVDRLRYCS